mgnify:CR=1 FL=1
MVADLSVLRTNLTSLLTDKLVSIEERLGELTVVVRAADMFGVLTSLRDAPELRFEQMMDLCGVDYSTYGSDISEGGAYLADDLVTNNYAARFAVEGRRGREDSGGESSRHGPFANSAGGMESTLLCAGRKVRAGDRRAGADEHQFQFARRADRGQSGERLEYVFEKRN